MIPINIETIVILQRNERHNENSRNRLLLYSELNKLTKNSAKDNFYNYFYIRYNLIAFLDKKSVFIVPSVACQS